MTEYSVNFDNGETVVIALNPFERAGFKTVGTFEHQVDPVTQITDRKNLRSKDGTHVFVNKAREVLEEAGIPHRKLIFRDEATNVGVDNEADMSTDALPVSEPATDTEVSSQKGGVASTVDTPAEDTLPNGVSDAEEAREPVSNPDSDAVDNAGQPGNEDSTDEKPEEKPETETVAALKERLKSITDKDLLQQEYDKEQNGAKRATALKAIEDRAAELDAE